MPRIDDRGGWHDWVLKHAVQEVISGEIDLTSVATHYLYEFQNDARVTRITLIIQTDASDNAGASTFAQFEIGTDSDPNHFVTTVTLSGTDNAGDTQDLTLASKDITKGDKLQVDVTRLDFAATARFVVEFVEDVAV